MAFPIAAGYGVGATIFDNAAGGIIASGIGGAIEYSRKRKGHHLGAGGSKFKKSKVAHLNPNRAPRRFLPEQKMARNTTNALAHRASMKVVGKKNIKRPGKKPVKVSKSLRKKVEKVIEGKKCFGRYETFHQGKIGVSRSAGANNVNVSNTQNQVAAQLNTIRIGDAADTGYTRCWWNAMQVGTNFEQGDDFNFFTPLKILNAASVLWNNKVIAKDWQILTGNLRVSADATTGNPAAGALNADFGHSVHVINSYVQFNIRNMTQRQIKLEVYNCTPKTKFQGANPLTTLDLAIRNQLQSAFVSRNRIIGGNSAGTSNDHAINNPIIPPKAFDGFNESWKYERMEMVIQPGETCVHSVQGPRNYTLDFSKLLAPAGGSANAMSWYKPTSVSVMMSVLPDLQYATAGVTTTGSNGAGRWFPGAPIMADDTVGLPIAVEFRECYKMSMPEESGFMKNSEPAAGMQILNWRRPVTAWANFAQQYDKAIISYTGIDEENPAATKSSSLLF